MPSHCRLLATLEALRRCVATALLVQEDSDSCARVLPLRTEAGDSATTSEPGSASSSLRLISSHCGFSPGRVRCRAKPPLQLLAVEDEDRVAALQRLRPGNPAALLVAAPVPDDHAAASDPALELVVGDLVVLDLDREAFDRRVHRRALGYRPGAHRPVDLEPEVEVVGGRRVLLDDEDAGADAADRELLVALGLDALDLDRLDPAPPRPLVEERDQLLDRGLRRPRRGTRTRPSSPFRTQPITPRPSARATVASRKPTPWTFPPTRARTAIFSASAATAAP